MVLEKVWWSYLMSGLFAVCFGGILFAWPKITVGWLLFFFAIWVIFHGILLCVAALRGKGDGWGWGLFMGIAAIVIGIVTLAWPQATALVVLWLIAIYAIVGGARDLVVAFAWAQDTAAKVLFALIGLVGVGFGIWMILDPKGGATAILWVIALFAVLWGALEMILSIFIRSQQKHDTDNGPLPAEAA
jgi:uncharacterized membrane protein HdeD (DUF308 family)